MILPTYRTVILSFIATLSLICNCVGATTTPVSSSNEVVVRIVVLGRKSAGTSSAVRELTGPHTQCGKPEGTESLQNIYEYTISNIPSPSSGITYKLKLLDLPGIVERRSLGKLDSQLLATLKAYWEGEASPPDFLLALTPFDEDLNFGGNNSQLVRFLKRIDVFKTEFVEKFTNKPLNTVFLLTRLMSDTEANQKNPSNKINNFREIIKQYSSFTPASYSILVGDNHAYSEHGAKLQNGYYLLPNGELYPKNLWEAMIHSLPPGSSSSASQVQAVINALKNNREVEMRCDSKFVQTNWDEYDADADSFRYLMDQESSLVEGNEVNSKIEEVFTNFSKVFEGHGLIQKNALQKYLQNAKIVTIKDIPKSYAGRLEIFQRSSLISSPYPTFLLNQAFSLEMPVYMQSLTVGYGYNVLEDVTLSETPFKTDRTEPSSVGYQFPNFMKCKKFPSPQTQAIRSYSQSFPEYYQERMKHLKVEENLNQAILKWKPKEGFNLAPEQGSDSASLTAVSEIRILRCVLSNKSRLELNSQFLEDVNSLKPVQLQNENSVAEWKAFFGKYGTHIVAEGYGGSRLVGRVTLTGTNVTNVMESRSKVNDILSSILKFTPVISVSGLGKPIYGIGELNGEGGTLFRQLSGLPQAHRTKIINEWKDSLNTGFVMLKTKLMLGKISLVVQDKVSSPDKGEMVDEALEILLGDGLKYRN